MYVEGNDGGHAGLHRVVILASALHLDQVAALMRHVEGFLLAGRTKEVLDAFFELLSEQQLQWSVQDLIPLVAKKRGTAGVGIDDDAMVGLVNANKHDGATAIGPILQHDLFLQVVIVLDGLVDLVVHVLVVLDGLEVVDVEAGDLLTVGDTADVLVALLHLLSYLDAGGSNLIQFLEIRVIFVKDTPKL